MKRNGLGSYILKGEKGSNDYEAAVAFTAEFTKYLAKEEFITVKNVLKIMINFDEGGIQYKSIPTRGLLDIKQEIKAKKPVKSRFTVCVGTSACGHKFKPIIIGKSLKPRCFRNMRKEDLPCYYYRSDSAWMTQDIFYDWFINGFQKEVHEHFGPEQQIYVLLDNCRAHPPQDVLDSLFPNIMVWMLPPNTTALIQPMDMGIIYALKAHTKKKYYTELANYDLDVNAADPVVEFMKSYTLKDAIYHLAEAWESISSELIQKCYENVFDYKLFMATQEELFGRKQEWEGLNFRGFEDTNVITAINKKKKLILERNRKTMKELCCVDVEEVAGNLNNVLQNVAARNNRRVETFSATAITEDIEFNPYCSTNYDDEILEVLTGIEPTLVDEFEGVI